MLTSKHKEGVMEVRRQLVETASREKLPIKMSLGKIQITTKKQQSAGLVSHEIEYEPNKMWK